MWPGPSLRTIFADKNGCAYCRYLKPNSLLAEESACRRSRGVSASLGLDYRFVSDAGLFKEVWRPRVKSTSKRRPMDEVHGATRAVAEAGEGRTGDAEEGSGGRKEKAVAKPKPAKATGMSKPGKSVPVRRRHWRTGAVVTATRERTERGALLVVPRDVFADRTGPNRRFGWRRRRLARLRADRRNAAAILRFHHRAGPGSVPKAETAERAAEMLRMRERGHCHEASAHYPPSDPYQPCVHCAYHLPDDQPRRSANRAWRASPGAGRARTRNCCCCNCPNGLCQVIYGSPDGVSSQKMLGRSKVCNGVFRCGFASKTAVWPGF